MLRNGELPEACMPPGLKIHRSIVPFIERGELHHVGVIDKHNRLGFKQKRYLLVCRRFVASMHSDGVVTRLIPLGDIVSVWVSAAPGELTKRSVVLKVPRLYDLRFDLEKGADDVLALIVRLAELCTGSAPELRNVMPPQKLGAGEYPVNCGRPKGAEKYDQTMLRIWRSPTAVVSSESEGLSPPRASDEPLSPVADAEF
eukprot:TRINITY_DN5924_c0_g1_i4.p1 TRINITY_DN5924_c0_g1~~TRINITY_DN5924_c0_g1_i4.p1  ORF type:complete len:200 (+),score=7.43 TRINITY_DN5924_c0_g1_i4:64-663(+)